MLNTLPERNSPHTQRATARKTGRNTPAIEGRWLNDASEVFTYLQRHEMEKDGWWRTMSSTLTLLKQARSMMENAERQIALQEKRITELTELSDTDELTELLNRRGFIRNLDRELDRVERDKSQGGLLILIDLDNFKMINDKHSHQAGDAALKLVAQTLTHDIRTMDIAGRLGGDEFVLLFVNTTRKEALERAQQLIIKLNNLSFVWDGNEISVRASLGLKEYKKGSRIENIFSAADKEMYANKKSKKPNKEQKKVTMRTKTN